MKWFFLCAYLLTILAGLILSWLNLRHQKACCRQLPPELIGRFKEKQLRRALSYSAAKTRLGLFKTLFDTTLLALFIFGPWLPLYDRWLHRTPDAFIGRGTLFFLGLLLIGLTLSIPFDLYRTFVIETRYGFNTTRPGLWLSDFLKGTILSLVLAGVLVSASLWLVHASPGRWWLWVWLFALLYSLFVMALAPRFIEPLFHRIEPLKQPGFEERIRRLAEQAGIKAGRILQIDASRRSRHANAYFSGFGRQKRIVLFDTLLRQLKPEEILAVLAHEMGHWRHRHLPKRLIASALTSLAALYLAYLLLNRGGLPALVGLQEASFPAQVLILSVLASIPGFLLTPCGAWLSRRHEWQADRFASRLTGKPEILAEALIKLAGNNLANLCPHPWHTWFYSCHPPLAARIRSLQPAGHSARHPSPAAGQADRHTRQLKAKRPDTRKTTEE